jgi:hypothetical protein
MEYESLFSTSVKQKIRLVVEQSESPMAMTDRVKAEFGDAALGLARQMAAETRGFAWLRQEQYIRAEGADDTLFAIQTAADLKYLKTQELARSLARGRAAKSAEAKASVADIEVETHQSTSSVTFVSRISLQVGLTVGRLWSKYSIFVWIALAVWGLVTCVDDHEKQKVVDEKASVGALATITGSMFAAAYKSCNLIGFSDFDLCSNNSGILVQDSTAKQLASMAIDQRKNYIKTCEKYYSQDYCWSLLNRAFRISQNSNR